MTNIRRLNHNYLLYIISSAAFLVFFQTFMVAPIIPKLARVFKVSPTAIGAIIPAFLIPYGISTLFYGPLSDRYGRKPILYICLLFFVHYNLGEIAIGIALLGYGIPGFVFGPAIGRVADRVGRSRLIPTGLVIAGLSSFLPIKDWPLA